MKKLQMMIALAACSSALQLSADNLATVQVMPAGIFYPADGREMKVPGWRMDAAIAARVIERFNRRATPLVIDYEHQTLRKEENGQPAPAAAWFRKLVWQDDGLFAEIELTDNAQRAVASREYKFFSPVFSHHPETGEVLELMMGALTNTPAIDGMSELQLLAAATFGAKPLEDTNMSLLARLIAMLAMSEASTQEQVVTALSAKLDACKQLGENLGSDEPAAMVAACTALKAKAASNAPDPAKFVPVQALEPLQTQVAALTAKLQQQEADAVDEQIAEALADGRLVAGPMEAWARDLAAKDRAALNTYLASVKPLSALQRSQTAGRKPPVDAEAALTDEEIAVCNRMGITQDEYKKARTNIA